MSVSPSHTAVRLAFHTICTVLIQLATADHRYGFMSHSVNTSALALEDIATVHVC
jgi:hypothetical protein